MKLANAVEVRDVPASESTARYGDRQLRQEMEDILRRYPNISEEDTATVLNFLRTGTHMDVGLVAGSDELKDKVRAFRKQHRRKLGLKWHEILLFVAATGGPAAAMFWRYLA